ncbi:hypothetical protein D3C75_1274480 [compost metagenome]
MLGELRLLGVVDLQDAGAVGGRLDDDPLGERQADGHVDQVVVEDLDLELDGVLAALQVLQQFPLVLT